MRVALPAYAYEFDVTAVGDGDRAMFCTGMKNFTIEGEGAVEPKADLCSVMAEVAILLAGIAIGPAAQYGMEGE